MSTHSQCDSPRNGDTQTPPFLQGLGEHDTIPATSGRKRKKKINRSKTLLFPFLISKGDEGRMEERKIFHFPFPSAQQRAPQSYVYRVKAIKARVKRRQKKFTGVDPPPPQRGGQTFDTPCKVNFRVSPPLAPPPFQGYEAR